LQKEAREFILALPLCVFIFWQNVLYFIVGNIDEHFTLLWKDVLLGIFFKKKPVLILFYFFIISMAKFTFINAIF